MKKFLILALSILAVFTVMLFLPKRTAGTSYPLDTVRTVVLDSAAVLGGNVVAERTVSGQFRGLGRLGRVGMMIRELTGNKVSLGARELLIVNGSNQFTITMLFQDLDVLQMQIQPAPSASTQSADLKREILKKLPGIDFMP